MNDIVEFEAKRTQCAEKLGKDQDILKLSRELLHRLDSYNYSYLWTAAGVPIIQTPADIIAHQEVVWKTKPSLIIETGIARGGSLINSAMALEVNGGQGKVIGIDIDIREHNREVIENHKLARRIETIQGSSIDVAVFEQVAQQVSSNDKVMVVLDSNHTCEHVREELELWGKLVTKGCYLVVADTMLFYATEPVQGSETWTPGNDPLSALNKYMETNDKFQPDHEINGKLIFSGSFNGYMKAVK